MKISAVLFDATGVLIEPAQTIGQTYAEAARDHGVDHLPAWRLEDAFRRVLRHAPPRVFPDLAPNAVENAERAWWRELVRQTFQATDSTVVFDDFTAFFEDLYDRFARPDAWRLRAGALEALRALADRGLALGVVSNFDHRLPDILEGLGIARFLGAVSIPSRCGAAKPDPGAFLTALSLLGARAREAVFVGHDPAEDVAGASGAGLVPLVLAEGETLATLPARIEQLANLGS